MNVGPAGRLHRVACRKQRLAPVSLEISLPALTSGSAADLCTDADIEALAFDTVDLQGLAADGARLLDCRLVACQLDDARLRRSRLSSCQLEGVTAAAADLVDSGWLDVVVRGGRIGALVAHGSNLMRVAFVGVRLDYVNLRGSTLAQVRLVDCRIGELDLGEADAAGITFEGCQVDRLVVTGATLKEVELTGADLEALEGVGSLSGATISQDQLTRLAPALAAHLGVKVEQAP